MFKREANYRDHSGAKDASFNNRSMMNMESFNEVSQEYSHYLDKKTKDTKSFLASEKFKQR